MEETIQAVNLELFKTVTENPDVFRLRIENFQNIVSAELEFEVGITVIAGDSNNGKSAIFRAIKAAAFNRSGDDFINYDAKKCMISIDNSGKTLEWTKSKDGERTKYVINGEPFVKVGKTQFPKVLEVLNFKEIKILDQVVKLNFWDQMAYPFLMDKTPGQLFQFFAISSDNEKIGNALKKMKEDMSEYSDKINIAHAKIDILRVEVDKLESLEAALNPYSIYFENVLALDSEVALITDLERLFNMTSAQMNTVNLVRDCLSHIDVEKVFLITSEITVLDDLQARITDHASLSRIVDMAARESEAINGMNNVLTAFKPLDLNAFGNEIATFNDMGSTWQRGKNISNQLSVVNECISTVAVTPMGWDAFGGAISDVATLEQMISQIQGMLSLYENYKGVDRPEAINVGDALALIKEVGELNELLASIKSMSSSIDGYRDGMSDRKREMEEIKKELEEFKQCPLCGGNMENCGGVK